MSVSTNQFKKKKISFDFSDNAMMTSSVRAPSRPSQYQEYLTLQKEYKKLKKKYNELSQKYDRMKDFNISQRIELELNMQQANHQISYLKQERQMLRARIKFLQKESSQMTKSYQRPLNRSIIKSGLKRSTLGDQNSSNLNRSHISPLKTDRSSNSQTSLQFFSRVQKDLTQNDSQLNDFSFTQNNENTLKFDKNWNQKKPLIYDENLIDQCLGCANKKCLDNYSQLQYLRESVTNLADKMEDIYLKIDLEVQKRLNQKNIAQHKKNLENLCKQSNGSDFFYKEKPTYLLGKIEDKLKEFIKGQSFKKYNPMLEKVKQKMKDLKREQQVFREEFVFETFDWEEMDRQFLKMMEKQEEQLKICEQILRRKEIKDPKFEQLRRQQQAFIKSEMKRIKVSQKK